MLCSSGGISWFIQRHSVSATSTADAEIITANECSIDVTWLK